MHPRSAHRSTDKHPIIDVIGKVIHKHQEKKANEQEQHDEIIRKTQELKDRERSIHEHERAIRNREINSITNIIDFISVARKKEETRLNEQAEQRRRDELDRKERELRERANELYEQQARLKKTRWEGQRSEFTIDYNRIKSQFDNINLSQFDNIKLSSVGQTELDSLLLSLNSLIDRYDINAYHSSVTEQQMRSKLSDMKHIISMYLKWQNEREKYDAIMRGIIDMTNTTNATNLIDKIPDMNMCLNKYTYFKDHLNPTEQMYIMKLPKLIEQAQIQIQSRELKMKQQLDRSRAVIAEQNIQRHLIDGHDCIHKGQFEMALNLLKRVSNESKNIVNWLDVSEDLRNKMNKLDVSIKILQDEIYGYKQRRVNSSKWAVYIIENALNRSLFINKTLLERHYSRLFKSITIDLNRNWYKFDRDINMDLFDKISQCITNELVETTFIKRWAPLNWTNAALYLNRSKLIAPEISILIDSYIHQPIYIEIPIFEIPVAEEVNC